MATFTADQVIALIQALGGDTQQAQQALSSVGQVDTSAHADLLNSLGVDPAQLESGGYQQHLDAAASQAQDAASGALGSLGLGGDSGSADGAPADGGSGDGTAGSDDQQW